MEIEKGLKELMLQEKIDLVYLFGFNPEGGLDPDQMNDLFDSFKKKYISHCQELEARIKVLEGESGG
jgi:hypothetical protein